MESRSLAPAVRRGYLLVSTLLALGVGCNRRLATERLQPAPGPKSFPVTIREPKKLTSIESGGTNAKVQEMRVACKTCHSMRAGAAPPTSVEALQAFHQGLTFRHGPLECASCHDPAAPSARIRLASGKSLPLADALELCGQCHGPQLRDFHAGAHGGMTGYWDLSRGPRERNHCVDCHDPHAPRYVGGQPVHQPRDRFLSPAHAPALPPAQETPHG